MACGTVGSQEALWCLHRLLNGNQFCVEYYHTASRSNDGKVAAGAKAEQVHTRAAYDHRDIFALLKSDHKDLYIGLSLERLNEVNQVRLGALRPGVFVCSMSCSKLIDIKVYISY